MSLFNILNTKTLGDALKTLTQQAGTAVSNAGIKPSGNLGGLLGAGALGALLGNVASGSLMKNAALVGVGAVAWNFYQKWAAGQQAPAEGQSSAALEAAPATMQDDATAELVIRAMVYAARADGTIDATERQRMEALISNMLPGQDVGPLLARLQQETLDPSVFTPLMRSAEQCEDVYRLSCMVIDIDHFMERGYLDALAQALQITPERKAALEQEAHDAREQLQQSLAQ